MAGRNKISTFFELTNQQDMLSDTKQGKPLVPILETYFESKTCVDIDYEKNLLSLSFKIFNTVTDEKVQVNSENIENGNQSNTSADTIPLNTVRSTVPSNAQQDDQVDGMPRGMSRLSRLLSREEKDDQYWFLKLLAKEKALKSLCHHPYITTFLDLHYSIVEKARSQMKDSVPHLALTLLFLVLVSTMPGHLQDNY